MSQQSQPQTSRRTTTMRHKQLTCLRRTTDPIRSRDHFTTAKEQEAFQQAFEKCYLDLAEAIKCTTA
jgi:heme oxygenase